MSVAPYTGMIDDLGNGDLDFVGGDIRAILVTADYVFDEEHGFLDEIDAGYRVGSAVALAGQAFTARVFDADDVTFTAVAAGDTVVAVVLYLHTGTESTSRLIGYYGDAYGFPVSTNDEDVTVEWPNDEGKIIWFRSFGS